MVRKLLDEHRREETPESLTNADAQLGFLLSNAIESHRHLRKCIVTLAEVTACGHDDDISRHALP
jgi:hypothetical protein